MATLTDDDIARLQQRARDGTLTVSDARRLLAEALLERGARKAAEEDLARERFYHADLADLLASQRTRYTELRGEIDALKKKIEQAREELSKLKQREGVDAATAHEIDLVAYHMSWASGLWRRRTQRTDRST
jgi:hypothetical protein